MKTIIFSFFLAFLFGQLQAQPTRKIPASVLPLLDKAEYLRATFRHDSAVVLLEQAQKEYQRLGLEYERLCLYPKIFIFTGEMALNDSLRYFRRLEEFQTKRMELYPNDKWLESRYYLSEAWFYNSMEYDKKSEIAAAILEKNNFYNDWEIEFYYRVRLNLSRGYDFPDDNELKNYQLIQKNVDLDSLKTAYLYHIYPAYLWYGVDGLSSFYLAQKDYEKALDITYKTLGYLEKAPYLDSVFYSTSFHQVASIYSTKGDYNKAIEFEQKAIKYIPSTITHSYTHYNSNLAYYYNSIEQNQTAIRHAKIALKYTYTFKNSTDEKVMALTQLVENYTLLNRFVDAKPYVDSILVHTNQNDGFYTLPEIGYFYQKQNDYTTAQRYYEQATAIYRKITQKNNQFPLLVLQYRAEWELANNQPLKALSLYQQASNKHVNDVVFKDDFELAPLDKINDDFNYLKLLLQKTACIKKAYIDKKDFSALKAYQTHANLAIKLLNNLREGVERDNSKTTLLNLSFQAYEHSIRAQFLTDNLEKKALDFEFIFKQMEDSKAFLLSNSLQEQQAKQFGGIPSDLLGLEKELTHNIQFYTQKQQETDEPKTQKLYQDYVFQFSQRLDSLKDRFKREFPKYHSLKYADNYVPLAKIQSFLQPKQAILSYFEGVEEIFLLYIEQKEVKFFPIPKPDNYSSLVKSFREIITDSRGEFELKKLVDISTVFYQLFIPFELDDEVKRLIIIADGSLHYTPFETFMDKNKLKNGANNSYNNLPYLILDKSISYQYSAQLWHQLHQNSQPTKTAKMLAFAPDYKPLDKKSLEKIPEHLRGLRNSLSPLSGTISEVESLEKLYAGKFFYNQQAVENQFKTLAPQYNVIHLAMHGLVDEESPEFSSLAFSAGHFDEKNKPDSSNLSDNFLQCYEIKALELNADLVVLSACETAFGKYERGEGAISIGRSFFYNGTKSLLMTQWSINDASTPILIGHFYAGLQQGKTKDEALQYAKIQYLSQTQGLAAHPAFWAAFVQMGNTFNLKMANTGYFYPYILFGSIILLAVIYTILKKRENKMEK